MRLGGYQHTGESAPPQALGSLTSAAWMVTPAIRVERSVFA